MIDFFDHVEEWQLKFSSWSELTGLSNPPIYFASLWYAKSIIDSLLVEETRPYSCRPREPVFELIDTHVGPVVPKVGDSEIQG